VESLGLTSALVPKAKSQAFLFAIVNKRHIQDKKKNQ